MRKVSVRIPAHLYEEIRELVREGEYESLSAFVRDAIAYIIERYARDL